MSTGAHQSDSARPQTRAPGGRRRSAPGRAFTLLEVMIALGLLGIAMLALLSLHHQDLRDIIRAQNLTKAAMLAQGLMTEAELEGFPPVGKTQGDFHKLDAHYRNFRWQRVVEQSPMFPDIREVEVRILYGPGLRQNFTLTEFLHYPQSQTGGPQPAEPPTNKLGPFGQKR